jgi:hypothetical protein
MAPFGSHVRILSRAGSITDEHCFNPFRPSRSRIIRGRSELKANTGEDEMPIITVVLTLLVVGVLLWLINTYIPMQSTIKGLLNAIVVIMLVIWLLNIFGLMHYVTDFKVGTH